MSDDDYEVLPSQNKRAGLSPDLANSYTVKPETLTRWNKTLNDSAVSGGDDLPGGSKFPYDEKLNRKLILWQGNLCDLVVDAIVNTTNERLNEQIGLSGTIFQRAGPDLMNECMRTEGCHTGEAVITKGYNLPASYVIHTVGPRYSVKYQNAAENALHGCYRRSLEVLKEQGLESIAFPLVNTDRKGYPKENAAHISIRTVRRFLERYGSSIHTVIFCMDNAEDARLYERILPLYFPRDKAEEVRVASLLPKDVGNELGESVQADRKIRISAMPGMQGDDDVPTTTVDSLVSKRRTIPVSAYEQPYDAPAETPAEEKKADVFGSMQDNPDDIRRKADAGKSKDDLEKEDIERRYATFLRRSREEDLSDLEAMNFIFPSGVDSMGRPVIVFVAHKLPASSVDLNRILLYMIKLLDPIVENEYTVVYFHTNIQAENKPPFAWLKQVYEIFNRKYKKNLKRLYIVHPTFWVKLVLLFATPFISKKFFKKVTKVERLTQLYEDFDPSVIKIDETILKFDQETNAADYASQYKNVAAPVPGAEPAADGSAPAEL